jgi:two-component system, OmpR family, osmolarity sensor histidine kinase EnvZ
MFAQLKKFMPSGLYGRAALILIVPVVTIQLVVSVAFIQRHFERVTQQMTGAVVTEVIFLRDRIEAAADLPAAQAEAGALGTALRFQVELPSALVLASDQREVLDWSGREVIATFRDQLSGVQGVHLLSNPRRVLMVLDSAKGPMALTIPRDRLSASNPHQLLVLMILTSVLMTLIAYFFLRNQLRPIKRLAEAASAFGRGNHVPYRPRGAQEVRAAGRAFLDMRERIERHMEQRTMMLSGISHDLRTPLTRLRLGLAMQPEDEEQAALLRDVADMQRLVDEFLSFAKGDATEASEETDPLSLVHRIVENALRGGQPVSLGRLDGEGTVNLRPSAVSRALENLIGNAIRYGKRAQVSVSITPRSVVFVVEDDGPGIPADRREEALKPFSRLDSARDPNKGGGVGLGLAIAADIAQSHGGSLRLGVSRDMGGLRAELQILR